MGCWVSSDVRAQTLRGSLEIKLPFEGPENRCGQRGEENKMMASCFTIAPIGRGA